MTEQVVTNALAFHRANRDPSNFAAKVRSRAWWGFQFETSVSLCNLTPAAVLLSLLRDACRGIEHAEALSPVLQTRNLCLTLFESDAVGRRTRSPPRIFASHQTVSRTTSTEHGADRMIDSAVLPSVNRARPVRPCVPTTTSSADAERA